MKSEDSHRFYATKLIKNNVKIKFFVIFAQISIYMSEDPSRNHDLEPGMMIYEEIVNNVDCGSDSLDQQIHMLKKADSTGQFLCSTARYLAAVDRKGYASYLPTLIEAAIERDRERRYIGQLLEAIWGKDYADRADELRASDDCFRRLYKRIYPVGTFD